MRNAFLATAIACLFSYGVALTQFSAEATVTSMLDDNVNNNYLRTRDRVTEATVKTGYDWESEQTNTQIFYLGSVDYFSMLTERTYHSHAVGTTFSYLFDENDQTLLNAGGTYSTRLGRGDYAFYDNMQFSAYANVRHYFLERLLGRMSYNFRTVTFPELREFNYVEHSGFLQTTMFLPTRTTLILEADLGAKIYSTPNGDSGLVGSMSGYGKGRRSVTSSSTPTVTQFTGLARIGHPIMEGTGLSLTTSYQVNLEKESRYLSSDYGAISDDELFDDHYGYEGLNTNLMLTQLLPADMTLKLSGSIQNRNYSDRPAYDLDGTMIAPMRADTRKVLTLLLEKRFDSAGISVGLSYDYIVNSSNDVFYDYTNNALTVRLSFDY